MYTLEYTTAFRCILISNINVMSMAVTFKNILLSYHIFSNGPASHVDLVDKLQKNSKVLSKNLQTVLKDLAVREVNKLKAIVPPPLYYSYHRKEAEPDFMNIFIKELGNSDIFLFLSTGDEKTVGNIVLYGNEEAIKNLGMKYV